MNIFGRGEELPWEEVLCVGGVQCEKLHFRRGEFEMPEGFLQTDIQPVLGETESE